MMIGRRGWIVLIGVMVFLIAGGECLIGDDCCKEDWLKFIAPVTEAYKGDRKSQAFKDAIKIWVADRDTMSAAELDDLCGGQIGYKCEGTKDKATCSCNAETNHMVENNNCVAGKADDMCSAKDPCKKGMKCEGGMCKEGGDGRVEKTGVDGNGTGPGMGGGSGSYTPRPIMWVIIGGLALIPAASS